MPARRSQDNFLKYLREQFGSDKLIEHGTLPLPETAVVVNPAHRQADQIVRRERAKPVRLQVQLAAHTLPHALSPERITAFAERGEQLRERIGVQSALFERGKEKRGQISRKVQLKELPEAERYRQLCPESKHFIDTIKVIAYRAESALAGELGEHLQRGDDKRAPMRRILVTPANLRPDYERKILTVELHRLGSPLQDAAVAKLCAQLTATETCLPTTDLRLVYRQLGSDRFQWRSGCLNVGTEAAGGCRRLESGSTLPRFLAAPSRPKSRARTEAPHARPGYRPEGRSCRPH